MLRNPVSARLLILITLMMSVAYIPVRAPSQPIDVPLYYHFTYQDGLVIKAAGLGVQRTLVPQPAAQDWMRAHWSPSGRWWAWSSFRKDNQGLTEPWTARTGVVNSAGGQLKEISLPEYGGGWSPTADLLIVERDQSTLGIYDPLRRETVLTVATNHPLRWTGPRLYSVGEQTIRVWELDGTLHERTFDHTTWSWTPDGRLVYWEDSELVLEDLSTGEQTRLPIPFDCDHCEMDWHPDGQHAILRCDYGWRSALLWFLSVPDQRLTQIDEAPVLDFYYAPVWIDNLGFLVGGDGYIYVTDVITGDFSRWNVPQATKYTFYDTRFWASTFETQAVNGVLYVFWAEYAWRYDPVAPQQIAEWSDADRFSPDGRYRVAFRCDGDPRTTCIVDHHTGNITITLPRFNGRHEHGGHVVRWHPTDPWVIIAEASLGRYHNHYTYSLVAADGSYYERLSGYANWLPENVWDH